MGSEATGSALDDLIASKNAEIVEAQTFEQALTAGDVEKKFWQTEKARLQKQWWDLMQQADAQAGACILAGIPGKRKTSTSIKEGPEEKEGQKDRDDPEEKEEGKEEEEEDKEDPVRPCKMRRHTI